MRFLLLDSFYDYVSIAIVLPQMKLAVLQYSNNCAGGNSLSRLLGINIPHLSTRAYP